MRNLFAISLAAAAGLFGAAISQAATITYDFSSDPGWISQNMGGTGQSDFGYNSTQQMIAAPGTSSDPGTFARNGEWSLYYTPLAAPLTDNDSFTVEARYEMTSADSGSYAAMYIGLFNTDDDTADKVNKLHVYIFKKSTTAKYGFNFDLWDDNGDQTKAGSITGRDVDTWYSMKIVYDGTTRTLSTYLDNSDTPTGSVNLAEDIHFSVNALGVTNDSKLAANAVMTGRVDDISLTTVPEPTSLGVVMSLGGLMLMRRRAS